MAILIILAMQSEDNKSSEVIDLILFSSSFSTTNTVIWTTHLKNIGSTTMRWYAHSVGWRDLSGLKRSLYTYTSCCFFLMKVRHRPETVGYKVQRECRVKFCPELQHSLYQSHPPTRVDYASNLSTQLESQMLFHHSIFYHCPAIRSNLSWTL